MALVLKWIGFVSSQMWLLAAGALGVLAMYVKGRKDKKKDIETKNQKQEIEALRRLNNVKTNTDRDSALERLRSNGDLRD